MEKARLFSYWCKGLRIVQLTNALAGIARRVPFYEGMRRKYEIDKLRRRVSSRDPLNVLIGGGQTSYEGWIFTDRDLLDITNPRDWSNLFDPGSIDRLLCEHVLEHLSEPACRITLAECYRYLKPGGLLRIAVPDGYRRDPAYVAEASPPMAGHQVLFDLPSLTQLLESTGFTVTPLEYFDQGEEFHALPWDESEGLVTRSVRFDTQTDFKRGDLYYTSLIVDARKP
jgi:predicted SAM-dependent methyltransferase